jgi:hypothetical protein
VRMLQGQDHRVEGSDNAFSSQGHRIPRGRQGEAVMARTHRRKTLCQSALSLTCT